MTVNEQLIKDNLYMAVNGEWLKTAKIPADRPTTGGFATLADNIEHQLMDDFNAILDGKTQPTDKYLGEFIKYYRLAADFDRRNKEGFGPALELLERVSHLHDLADWQHQLPDLTKDGFPAPFQFFVEPDMKDTQHYVLSVDVGSLILPDTTYYQENNPQAPALLETYRAMMLKLFKLAGYDDDFARETLEQALAFDRSMAPYEKDSTARADYASLYNPVSAAELSAFSDQVDLVADAAALIGKTPDKIIVSEPRYFEHLDKIVNPQTFTNLKSWLFVKTLLRVSPYLTDEARTTATIYNRALSGSKQAANQQKSAYRLASGQFSQVVGLYYGHKYFGEQAKADVEQMVAKMVAVYKHRLENNDWLSAATREQAIVKLNNLGVQVGYPDKLAPLYKQFVVDEKESLLTNDARFIRIAIEDNFSRWGKEVDRTEWEMAASTVNAYYNPSFNIIVFPAAILQAPFYSLDQSASANYGGIGAVIAHEISHAFDNNGAKFDEWGNMKNWWTDADKKHFDTLAQDMVREFDGLTTRAGKVNGKLVVSENIADAGGLSCALEAAKETPDANLRDFFINWARIWCVKSSLEREKLLLAIDVHAPQELRANIQPRNLADFYTTFNVQPGDGMYMKPEDRVNIW